MARSIVLLHGVQSSRTTWWRQEQDLADLGWTVTALDLAGHGERADAAPGPLTIARLAEDVLARLPEDLDLLVGHSLGAVVALAVVAREPGAARAVVLEDPPGSTGVFDSPAVADHVEAEDRAVATDPHAFRDARLAADPTMAPLDAAAAVRSRQLLDTPRIAAMLRTDPWDLHRMAAASPVPLHVLAALGPSSALSGSARDALEALRPPSGFTAVPSGHGLHRERPALWLHTVLRFADAVAPERR